jgi:preprotein translocase subunit SecB
MKAQKSPINLEYFAVLQSHYEFIQPKKEPKDLKKLFDLYELNIDFSHLPEDSGEIKVFVKIGINNLKKPLPGYKVLVEGVGIFILTNNSIQEKEQENLKFYSTVSILIGYLRNSISGSTASAPFGPYLLPPIDINDLFRQKTKNTKIEETQ